MNVIISVIVCTYNRANFLSECLQSLEKQTLNKDLFEVIVIDNNSTDNTQEIAASFSENILHFRIIHETKQGLSHARNRGWRESQGEYVAFVDDDAIAEPDWLSEIIFTFSSVNPVPDACGGRVELIWETPRPVWMHDSLLGPLGKFDFGETCFFITDLTVNLSGSNIAFKRGVSEKVGFFDNSLGRQGNNLLSNEEIDFFQRMHNVGLKIYYNPNIIVKHHVTKERTQKKWHMARQYWQGQSNAIMDIHQDPNMSGNLIKIGIRVYTMTKYFFFSIFYSDTKKRFQSRCLLHYNQGYVARLLGFN